MFLGLVNHLDMTEDVYWVTRFDQDIDDEWRGRCREFEDYYTIVEEEGNSCLYASSEDSDCFIVKPIKVDIVEYPYLNWRWKSVDRPPNGDESDGSESEAEPPDQTPDSDADDNPESTDE